MVNSVLNWRSLVILGVVAALAFAVACGGDDEPAPAPTPVPAPTPDFAKLIQDAVGSVPQGASATEIQDLVSNAVNTALAAQPGLTRADVEAIVTSATGDQLSAAEVQRIVDQSIKALPVPETLDLADISRLVEAALPALPESVSAAEISQIVQDQVEAGQTGQLTRGDVESLVAAAVEGAVGDQLSADDVKAIVDSSLMATNAAIEDAAMKADEARMTAMEAVEAAEAAYRGPDSITIAVGALPANLVANVIPSLQSRITSRLIYGQLAALNDETGQIEPELAESYGFLPGSTDTVELKLRQDITFHNGETLDAHGLLKSFELMMSETAEVAWAFRVLDRYVDPADRLGTLNEAVTVVDDYTLHFKLRLVDDTWANAFTFMPLPPVHLETVGPAGYSEEPIGTGPYKFVSWERDNYIQLTRWEDYPGPKPVIKNIRIRHVPEAAVRVAGLKAGEFDIITATPPENVPGLISDGFKIFVGDSTQSMYIGFNIYGRSDPLSNKLVRQALLYAVDMDGIYETVAGGYGSRLQCQIVAPGGFGYNADLVGRYDYDPDKAKELLAEAGYGDGVTIKGSVTNARYFRDRPLMDALVSQWSQVGVSVDLQYLESSEWLQQLINQTLPEGIMNIGLNWYLADNTTSMWGDGQADPAFKEMRDAKAMITDPVAREAEVKRIAEQICENAQALHAYTIPSVLSFGPSLPDISASKSFELKIPSQ
ncbi:MAG: ABC transporter substrate-binding protein [Chloroflexi bacterium]|nr:ABC transporter substrate-binding protein [Chloroflexota bacterium]